MQIGGPGALIQFDALIGQQRQAEPMQIQSAPQSHLIECPKRRSIRGAYVSASCLAVGRLAIGNRQSALDTGQTPWRAPANWPATRRRQASTTLLAFSHGSMSIRPQQVSRPGPTQCSICNTAGRLQHLAPKLASCLPGAMLTWAIKA